MTRRRRLAALLLAGLALAGAGAALAAWLLLRASLPAAQGRLATPEVAAPLRVERDAEGNVTVEAASMADAAFGLGFAHGQDRFFQMDLARRYAAGELAELFGTAAVETDVRLRLHRFRARAAAFRDGLPPAHQALAATYAAGVNAGLASLGTRPPEYWLFGPPRPWEPADVYLVIAAMALQLQDGFAESDAWRGAIAAAVPAPVYRFLCEAPPPLQAAIDGTVDPPAPIPAAEHWAYLRDAAAPAGPDAPGTARLPPAHQRTPYDRAGSNNWAVAGRHTADGRAILADDMHLGLAAPGTRYRASLRFADAAGRRHAVTGLSLPGAPFIVAGSNGRIAWGYTNTGADLADRILLEWLDPPGPPGTPRRYRGPDGPRALVLHPEPVRVRGAPARAGFVAETVWGPVLSGINDPDTGMAVRWAAHDPSAFSFRILDLMQAATLEEAVAAGRDLGIPQQNLVLADDRGRIALTVAGVVPLRFGHDGRRPASWADGAAGWRGWLDPAAHPVAFDPPDGLVWSANARVWGGEAAGLLGEFAFAEGERAWRIHTRLREMTAAGPVAEADLLALQLDVDGASLAPWRDLFLEAAAGAPAGPLADAAALVRAGPLAATADSVAYRIVREYRRLATAHIHGRLVAPVFRDADPRPDSWPPYQGAVLALARARPPHLADPAHGTWEAELRALATDVATTLARAGPLPAQTWGRANPLVVAHPLAAALPLGGLLLTLPGGPTAGDRHVVRALHRDFGASQRMVVSPGHEADGIQQIPAGQSGHFLSPHFGDQHRAWRAGTPRPFLHGPSVGAWTISPAP